LAILEKASFASAGVLAAGFMGVGVEVALGVGFGCGVLQAVRPPASIPDKTSVTATLDIFIF
jgi:hypothetical protein